VDPGDPAWETYRTVVEAIRRREQSAAGG